MHIGNQLRPVAVFVGTDYQHVGGLQGVQVLVGYAASYPGFAGGYPVGIEGHEFAVSVAFQLQKGAAAL